MVYGNTYLQKFKPFYIPLIFEFAPLPEKAPTQACDCESLFRELSLSRKTHQI